MTASGHRRDRKMSVEESTSAGTTSSETELRLLLEATLDLDVAARRAFLQAHASGPEIRQQVEDLIEREAHFGDFLLRPALPPLEGGFVEALLDEHDGTLPSEPAAIGPYRLLHSLGEGGMGRVFLAEQTEPVERQVALKLVHARLGQEAAARFRHERVTLGRLSHPNIARLYEAGSTPQGRPFVAMELVEGPPITTFCDRLRLSIDARLRLFISVCRGAQHAHQKQILHRDLKPSNILVTEVDGEPVAKIIDFGIAKSLEQTPFGDPAMSEAMLTGDRLLGTPQYMSPEALGRSATDDPDTRSDVYSLGVVLYELLVGVLPFSTPTHDLTRLMHEILSLEPSCPSQRFAALEDRQQESLAALRGLSPPRLRATLRGDLDCIVAKAMAKDREARYDSVATLADDLESVLAREPILAQAPSWSYRMGKWAQRQRLAATLVGLTAGGLILATLFTSIALMRAQEAEQRSRYEAQISRQSLDFLVDLFEAASPERAQGEPVDAVKLLELGVQKIAHTQLEPLPRAQILFSLAEVHLRLGFYPQALELASESLQIRQQELAADASQVLQGIELLANVERRLGNLDRAEPLLERLLQAAEATGEALPLADALNGLGNLRWRQQRLQEAEDLHLKALALRRQHLGPEAQEVAASHNNLGALYFSSGRYREAEPHLRQAAAIFEERLGPKHPRFVDALGNLGIVEQRLGNLRASTDIQSKVLAIRREVLGVEHPDTAAALHNLAMATADLGKLGQAEEGYRQSLALRRRILGEEHGETIKTQSNLGLLLWRQGHFAEAESMLQDALDRRRRLQPNDQLSLLRSRRNLAYVWRDTGRLRQARETLIWVLEAQQTLLGAEHREIAQTLHHLGVTARLEGNFDEAELHLRQSLAMRGRLAAPEDTLRAETLYQLGELENQRHRPSEALTLHRQALEIRRRLLPAEHPDLLASLQAVANAGS